MPTPNRSFPCLALAGAALLAIAAPAHALLPLISDDTGTQGTGIWQLELSVDQTRTRDAGVTSRERALNVAFVRGVTDTLDLGINLPWLHNSATGAPSESGVGDTTLGAKWRFFDDEQGWTLGVRPLLTLPSGSETRGLGNGRATGSLTLLSTVVAGPWTWLANVGYTYNGNDAGDRRSLWAASTALLYALSEQWTLAADVGANRSATPGASTEGFGQLAVLYYLDPATVLDLGWTRTLGPAPVGNTLSVGITLHW